MPQMDISILFIQMCFVVVYYLIYIFILKNILPLISAQLKMKNKLILKHAQWFRNNLFLLSFYKRENTLLLIKARSALKITNIFNKTNNIFFGIYQADLLKNKNKLGYGNIN